MPGVPPPLDPLLLVNTNRHIRSHALLILSTMSDFLKQLVMLLYSNKFYGIKGVDEQYLLVVSTSCGPW